MSNEIKIELRNICKQFPGVKALDNVSFSIRAGETHSIIGENGAGKSTLMKILAGAHTQSSGEIYIDGRKVELANPRDAINLGIGIVYQELNNFAQLKVCENLFANRKPKKHGLLSQTELRQAARKLLDEYGMGHIDENSTMSDLSLGSQQMIEIVGLLSKNVKIVILDEPTSALTEVEVHKLFMLIGDMKKKGVTILYISHKLDEVLKLSQMITVLKDGRHIITFENSENVKKNILVNYMVGRDVEYDYKVGSSRIGDELFRVVDLSSGQKVNQVSFRLRAGEILGVAGLEGAGRTELLETIFGWRICTGGEMYLRGQRIEIRNPKDAKKNRFAYLTKERKTLGLFLPLSLSNNIIAASIKKFSRVFILDVRKAEKNAMDYIDALQIKTAGTKQKVMNLSGGNQQKVLLSMWLTADPDIILIDEPTRGVDVGAKAEIHFLLREIVKQGKGIIMVSSEMPELMASCDRAIVMFEGKVTGELSNLEMSERVMMGMASGMVQ